MGQYYYFVILADDGKYIRGWLDPSSYNNGAKLIEHSYINNTFMLAAESLLGPKSSFYKSRIVWAGDYASPETAKEENLYKMCMNQELKHLRRSGDDNVYRYIINHSKCMFIDKKNLEIHPLALLVAEGNGSGGGDYFGPKKEVCGSWARDVISVDDSVPDGFEKFIPEFS